MIMGIINLVLSGLGGQGVLFMTKILAQTALDQGFEILGAETHGMAQRGGSVVSHLRLGKVSGSLVRSGTADFLVALDEKEAYRCIPFIKQGGKVFANAMPQTFPVEEVRQYFEEKDIKYFAYAATKAAADIGAPLASNLAMVGFFASFAEPPFTPQLLRSTVEKVSPERFREINLKVFDAAVDHY